MKLYRFVPFPSRMPGIYVEKINSKWYYSKETVEKIDGIYKDVFPWEISWVQEKFPKLEHRSIFGIEIWKLLELLTYIVLSIILYFILNPVIFFILKKLQKLLVHNVYQQTIDLLHELSRPIVFLVIISVLRRVIPSLQLVDYNNFMFMGLDIAETVFWVFVFLKLGKLFFSNFREYTKKTHTKLDEQLEPILGKTVSVIIIFLGFLHVLTVFGVNPTTVLAGASIGGIAVAFAAQDSVKNLIGTVVIFLDKPFHIGDWVEIGGVVGTVEKVGLRSTQIRAADTSMYQIPNSIVSEKEVNNKGLRLYRRYSTELGIRYDTPPELIEAFVKGVRALIVAHPNTRSSAYNVEFTGFGDSSLNILVNVYFKQLDWGTEQSAKHRLHIAIVKLAAVLNVEFAFPSSTLMIEQFPEKKSIAVKYNTDAKYIEQSVQDVLDDFSGIKKKGNLNVSSTPDEDS